MTDEYTFLLNDRIQKIQSIDSMYDLKNKSYISFSGGKDSTVLSNLIDIALPKNEIPRVFINTGIEYRNIVSFVEGKKNNDSRIHILKPSKNIKQIFIDYGFPFKSKEHSQKLAIYQRSGLTRTVVNYLGNGDKKDFLCPEKLKYQFADSFKMKVSDRCCFELKKNPCEKWSVENNKPISITGIRNNEGGLRQSVKGCTVFYDDDCKTLHKFHPLLPMPNWWIDEFIKRNNIQLCELYYAPYNFKRTGCKGCPYSIDLKRQLEIMAALLPVERKQCELIWGTVYAEYRRIGYRLDTQLSLFA